MSLEKLKLSESEIALHGVAAAPDKLSGTAQENKELFDRLIRECFAEKYNELIERLESMEAGKGVQSDTVRYIRVTDTGSLEISSDGESWITVSGGGSGEAYKLPVASAQTLGGIRIGEGLAIDGDGLLSVTSVTVTDLPDGDGVEY